MGSIILSAVPALAETINCDLNAYINEYRLSTPNIYLINYDGRDYFVISSGTKNFLVIDSKQCTLERDLGLYKELIGDAIFLSNPKIPKYIETYETIQECHQIALFAGIVYRITRFLNDIFKVLDEESVKEMERNIPKISAILENYGWKIDKKGKQIIIYSVKGLGKFARHSFEIQLAAYSSGYIENSIIGTIYDYSTLAYKISSDSYNRRIFHINSIEVLNSINKKLEYYISPEEKGRGDLIKKINSILGIVISNECIELSKSNNRYWNVLNEASGFYDSILRERDIYSANSVRWINNLESSANHTIMLSGKDMDKLGPFFRIKLWIKGLIYGYDTGSISEQSVKAEELYNEALYQYSRGFYISAKQNAEKANKYKNEVLEFYNSMSMQRFKWIFR